MTRKNQNRIVFPLNEWQNVFNTKTFISVVIYNTIGGRGFG